MLSKHCCLFELPDPTEQKWPNLWGEIGAALPFWTTNDRQGGFGKPVYFLQYMILESIFILRAMMIINTGLY